MVKTLFNLFRHSSNKISYVTRTFTSREKCKEKYSKLFSKKRTTPCRGETTRSRLKTINKIGVFTVIRCLFVFPSHFEKIFGNFPELGKVTKIFFYFV